MINSKRIEKICEFINKKQILEIGCDHAYITKNLFLQKKINYAYLIDISLKCLEKAKITLKKYPENTYFSVKNGFNGIKNDFIYFKTPKTSQIQVVIAGMGGQEIIKILQQDESEFFNNFVLQPQKNIYELRKFLIENNYKIMQDEVVKEGKFFYFVLKVTRKNLTPKQQENLVDPTQKTTKNLNDIKKEINKQKNTNSKIKEQKLEQQLLFGKISKSEDYKNYITYELSRKKEIAKIKQIQKNEKLILMLENILKTII